VRAVADALLAVEEDTGEFSSPQGEALGAALDGNGPVPADAWRQIVEFVEAKRPPAERRAILFKLTQERILEVCENCPTEASRLGVIYGRWVYESSFNFDTCALAFIDNCPFDVKVECILALLEMGTSHNRWYVERMFMRLCGPEMDTALARRLAVEFRADDSDICRSITNLERSIQASRDNLHPILVKTLEEICR